jgi:hypothetical protein
MSDEAKVVFIQDRIKKSKSRIIAGGIIIFLGAMLAVFAFALLRGTAWVVGSIGVFLIVFGLVLSLYYANERSILLVQLKGRETKVLTCRNCGKPIPSGRYTICPFCGSALVAPQTSVKAIDDTI